MPNAGTDWRDLAMLLLAFPELMAHPGPVSDRLQALDAPTDVLAAWQGIVAQENLPRNRGRGVRLSRSGHADAWFLARS